MISEFSFSIMFDLNGMKFKIAVNGAQPFIFLDKSPIDGSEAKILETLSEYLNFTYEFVDFTEPEGHSGEAWAPLMDSIANKQADFGMFNIFVTYERSKLVTYSYPYIIDQVTYICPKPKIQTNDMNLIQPFDIWIWISLVFNICLMTSIFLLLFKNVFNIHWILLSILMRQQFYMESKLRLILFSWLLAGVVLTSSYGGVIYSITASPLEVDRIDTIQDLNFAVKARKLDVIGIKNGIHFRMMKKLKFSGTSQEIGSALIGVQNVLTAINMLKSTEPYAFLLTKEKLFYILHYYGIKSHYIPHNSNMDSVFAINFIAIPMNKDFKYKDVFNLFISNVQKGGLIEYWNRVFYIKLFRKQMDYNQGSLISSSQVFSPLNIGQFYYIYLIISIGYLISSMIAMFEYLSDKYQNQNKIIQ